MVFQPNFISSQTDFDGLHGKISISYSVYRSFPKQSKVARQVTLWVGVGGREGLESSLIRHSFILGHHYRPEIGAGMGCRRKTFHE